MYKTQIFISRIFVLGVCVCPVCMYEGILSSNTFGFLFCVYVCMFESSPEWMRKEDTQKISNSF